MTRRPIPVLVAAGIGFVAVTVLAVALLNPFAEAKSRDPQSCALEGTGPAVAACLQDYFRRVAARDQVEETLEELDDMVASGTLDDCHVVAHSFGHIAFSEIRDLDRALSAGAGQCSNGYQHGVVEAAVGGAGSQPGSLHRGDSAACAGQLNDWLLDGCIHGLGHAFMYETGHNVARALARCGARVPEPSFRTRCQGGVMMENSMQHMHLGAARFRARASSACRGLDLDRDLLRICYSQIGEVSMFFFKHDIAEVLPLCRRVPNRFGQRACAAGAREELRWVQSQRKA